MSLPPEQLGDLIESYHKEEIHLKEQITDLCYFMKGGIEWESAWGMSFEEREIVVKRINKRLKEQNPKAKEYF